MSILLKAEDLIHGVCRKCGNTGTNFHPSKLDRCKPCLAEAQRAYRRKRPKGYWQNKDKRYALKKRYGMSLEDFERMAAAQSWCCAICGVDPRQVKLSQRGILHVDHNHSTGTVRALLCNGCNRAIGLINERPDVAESIARYLRANDERA